MTHDPNETNNADFYSDNAVLQRAMGQAVYDTLRVHKLLGYPIVIWRDGKAVWVPPEAIELPEELNRRNGAADNVSVSTEAQADQGPR